MIATMVMPSSNVGRRKMYNGALHKQTNQGNGAATVLHLNNINGNNVVVSWDDDHLPHPWSMTLSEDACT